jgi:hypothetical protein
MRRPDEYKQLARDVLERGRQEQDRTVKAGWEKLAETYFRLAEQSEKEGLAKEKDDPLLD